MMHRLLKSHLAPLARMRHGFRFWMLMAACWTAAALFGFGLMFLERVIGWSSWLYLPVAAAAGVVSAAIVWIKKRRFDPDWRELALRIESCHPDLNGLLLTAVEQAPGRDGHLNVFQERVLAEALRHNIRNGWGNKLSASRVGFAKFAHAVALAVFVVVLLGLRSTSSNALFVARNADGVEVIPGDTSLESGNSLVVMARFSGRVPASAELIATQSGKVAQRIPLVRSLADPMFGGSLPDVHEDLAYRIEYGHQKTRDFVVTVFEYPRLERADADLTYPDYTGKPSKRIENTRRISAVEGSVLDLALQFNKPVASARLIPMKGGNSALPLTIASNLPSAVLEGFPMTESATYELQLVDADGRTNKTPDRFVLKVLGNHVPEIKIASPRGDTRPSALEEMDFAGTVWDDFGIAAYGLAYTRPGEEMHYIQLGTNVPPNEKRTYEHVLPLEDLGMQPDNLLSWFIWADDIGPDGKLRRTMGDLYFAEVRPFEEVFREGQSGSGGQQNSGGQNGQGGQGGPAMRLAELQKQIINATWKLQRRHSAEKKSANEKEESKPALQESRVRQNTSESLHLTSAHPQIDRRAATSSTDRLDQQEQLRYQQHAQPYAALQVFGQRARNPRASSPAPDRPSSSGDATNTTLNLSSDADVIREAQSQVLDQARSAMEQQRDPRTAALWDAAIKDMQQALEQLSRATNSRAEFTQALTAEQTAYQSLLKLQAREYSVSRNRNPNSSNQGGRQRQLQRQLDQLDLEQSENRYETERLANAPQNAQRREQMQIMSRLEELARRQQDLNERLQELQTALQEARTEQERENIRRELKRLQEQQQRMVADADELRQRMESPENLSRTAEQREQLQQTREQMQRASEALDNEQVSQALAAGTRAQRQMEQMRDQMREESAGEFGEAMRQLRTEARELSRQQDEVKEKLDQLNDSRRRTLSDSALNKETLDQLAQQRQRLTNLLDQASEISQQAEEAEPLMSRDLYDTLRTFTQDDTDTIKQLQEELINRGVMTREFNDWLTRTREQSQTRSLDLTSELLEHDLASAASQTEQRARQDINHLRQGIEQAAERILGDDTEALRLARQQLDDLTQQLEREVAEGENNGTNGAGADSALAQQSGGQRSNREANASENQTNQSGSQGQTNQANEQAQRPGSGQSQEEQRESQLASDSNPSQQPGSQSGNRQPGNQRGDGQGNRDGQRNGGQQSGNLASNPASSRPQGRRGGGAGAGNNDADNWGGNGNFPFNVDRLLDANDQTRGGPITGNNFGPWSDGLREVEELVDAPALRNDVARARERARQMRQDFRQDQKKPDWAVVRLEIVRPLVEVRKQITEELARRASSEKLVPIDRDPVPDRYADLVRRYYEELGKDQ